MKVLATVSHQLILIGFLYYHFIFLLSIYALLYYFWQQLEEKKTIFFLLCNYRNFTVNISNNRKKAVQHTQKY